MTICSCNHHSKLAVEEMSNHTGSNTSVPHRKVNGVGPGLIFAKELLSLQHSAGDEIGLVPCAIGATSMDEWLPGTVLYEKMVCNQQTNPIDDDIEWRLGIVHAWREGYYWQYRRLATACHRLTGH